MTSTENRETTHPDEVSQLAQRVATARGKLPLQADRALYDALSEPEIAAERDLAEWIRGQRRKQERLKLQYEMRQQKLMRRNTDKINAEKASDDRWHRRALAARRRVSNPDARLAQLYRRAEWSSRALIGVVVLGMVWAGVNVQHNLVPSGDMSDPLYWLSYGFEAMISIPIITIMVVATTAARWGRELDRGKVALGELTLLGVTVALNAGPHLAGGEYARAAESAIAPIMVGVVIWLHAWVAGRYAYLIDTVPTAGDYDTIAPVTLDDSAITAAPLDEPASDGAVESTETVASNEAPMPVDEQAAAHEDDTDDQDDDNTSTASGGGVVPFVRRTEATADDAASSQRPVRRGRRWFGGELTDDEITHLAQEVYDSGRTQQSLDALVRIISDAVAGHAPTAIARTLGMSAHSTILRALNVADELYHAGNRVA